MVLGGGPSSKVWKSAIEFDPINGSFRSLPSLTSKRTSVFGCAVFNSSFHGGRPVVLAAGGKYQATAEILDFTQPGSTWSQSKIIIHNCNFFIKYFVMFEG